MANDVMIEAKGLTKYFGSFRALDRVSFEVKKGEIVGFLGPNGAGKSTTMRILTCYISASAGTARVHGVDAFEDPLEVRRQIGYLPQRAPLYVEMSVWDYLRFCSEMRGLDLSAFKSRMKKIVEVCGLARVLGKDIRTLSHGYRQRVGLGQALLHDPPVLILDEPTSDLDPNERAEVIRYIHETGKNRTILLSTHNLNEVEAVCARAIIVSKGRIVADGPLDEIKALSGHVRYFVTVAAKGGKPSAQECAEALRAVAGVSAVRDLPTDGSSHRFELRGAARSDLRAELFKAATQRGYVILELGRETDSLEDAFKALTRDDERADRGRTGKAAEPAPAPVAEEEEEEDEDEDDDGEQEPEEGDDEADEQDSGDDDSDDERSEDDDDEDDDEGDDDDDARDKPKAAAAKAEPAKAEPAKAEPAKSPAKNLKKDGR